MKKCKECGKEINKKAEICPHCGCRVKPNYLKVVVVLLCVLLIIVLSYLAIKFWIPSINSKVKKYKQDNIKYEDVINNSDEIYAYYKIENFKDPITYELNDKIDKYNITFIDDVSKINDNVFIKFNIIKNEIKAFSICYKKDDKVNCVNENDDIEETKEQMKQVFGEQSCTYSADNTGLICEFNHLISGSYFEIDNNQISGNYIESGYGERIAYKLRRDKKLIIGSVFSK